jgi:hypothetical protein
VHVWSARSARRGASRTSVLWVAAQLAAPLSAASSPCALDDAVTSRPGRGREHVNEPLSGRHVVQGDLSVIRGTASTALPPRYRVLRDEDGSSKEPHDVCSKRGGNVSGRYLYFRHEAHTPRRSL